MEMFRSLFGKLLVFVYHCFDRIVIQGHLPLLSREGHIVFFFRDVRGEYPITPKVLQQRTNAYRAWVDAYAGNHKIPVEKAKKGVSKEEHVRPYLERMERQNRYGVYFIFKSMEQGSCFKSLPPKYATDDPNYRIIRRDRKLYTHLYFYIRDEVLGPLAMCVGTYLPFLIFYYVNGHHYIENELKRGKVAYRKNDNAFLWVADPEALQAAADVSRRRYCGSGWTTGRSRWVPSFQRRSGRVYRCIGTTRSTKWSIAGTLSSSGMRRSTRSSSGVARWGC